ncbi:substrate-binding periplasmic protein [Paucibacter soli]|uniref:substrate-binding periplasmic protein n=1 Tax=Paucibacter soli TaxID=3133433 RepID=UPI0030B5302C
MKSLVPLLALCATLLCPPCGAAEPLRIASWNRSSEPATQAAEAVLNRAYAELVQPIEFVELPVRRALRALLAGEVDANLYRIAALAQEQPQLHRVETPVLTLAAYSYANKDGPRPAKWGDLAGLRVAHLRGVLLIEQQVPADARRVEAGTVDELFRLLALQMVDVVVTVEARLALPLGQRVSPAIARADAELAALPMHHYLGERHGELARRLDAVLARLKASGELDRLLQRHLQPTR